MLELKYPYALTYVAGGPTMTKTSKYIGNPVYFKRNYFFNLLFKMSYGDHRLIERSKIFKVVPIRGEA